MMSRISGFLFMFVLLTGTAGAMEHPCLLFSSSDIPQIQLRIDSGVPQEAWEELIYWCDVYLTMSDNDSRWSAYFGDTAYSIAEAGCGLGFAYQITGDTTYGNKAISVCEAKWNYQPPNHLYFAHYTRGLIFCYDYCYDLLEAQGKVQTWQGKIESLIDVLASYNRLGFDNNRAVVWGILGLAAMVIHEETEYNTAEKISLAQDQIAPIFDIGFSDDGVFHEGVGYFHFTMIAALPFMQALKRHFDIDLYENNLLEKSAEWCIYELLPGGSDHNNRMDSNYWGTHFVFAHLADVYDDVLGQYFFHNFEYQRQDKWYPSRGISIILHYDENIPLIDPLDYISPSRYFEHSRLVYFRTGWDPEAIVFHLDLGWCFDPETGTMLASGHDHFDKNCFTLYGYGERFAIDCGYGYSYSFTKFHNGVVFDDLLCGEGAGWGTSRVKGEVAEQISGQFCEYVHGDAKEAYNVAYWNFSEPDTGWDGTMYECTCKVENADRFVVFVKDDELPPYFVMADDINKDHTNHIYHWLLHTEAGNSFDISGNPIILDGHRQDNTKLEIHLVSPTNYTASVETVHPLEPPPEEGEIDGEPMASHPRLKISAEIVNPFYLTILFPHKPGLEEPSVTTDTITNGKVAKLEWTSATDYAIFKTTGDISEDWISTDAKLSLIREDADSQVTRFIMAEGTSLVKNELLIVNTFGDTVSIINSGTEVTIHGKDSVNCQIYAPEAETVYLNGEAVEFNREGDYVTVGFLLQLNSTSELATAFNNGRKTAPGLGEFIHTVFSSGDSIFHSWSLEGTTLWCGRELMGFGKYPALGGYNWGNLHAIWVRGDTLLHSFSDLSDNWSDPVPLFVEQSPLSGVTAPSILADSVDAPWPGYLYVTWASAGYINKPQVRRKYYVGWADSDTFRYTAFDSTIAGGGGFGACGGGQDPPVKPPPQQSYTEIGWVGPAIDADSLHTAHITWEKTGEVYYRKFWLQSGNPNDPRFNQIDTVSGTLAQSTNPCIYRYRYDTASRIVWQEDTETFHGILHRMKDTSWSSVDTVRQSAAHKLDYPVVFKNHVAWSESTGVGWEVFLAYCDSGGNWTTPQNKSNSNDTTSRHPQLCLSPASGPNDEYRYLIWTEGDDSLHTIDLVIDTVPREQDPRGGAQTAGGDFVVSPLLPVLRVWPNPFSAKLLINYCQRASGHLSLKIYDASGRLVETLVKEPKKAGTHEIDWEVKKPFPCGVYFVRLDAGGCTSTKKIILLY